MKKLLLFCMLLLILLGFATGTIAYRYPHVLAIAEEGFPASIWPAKGIYVDVVGEPVSWPSERAPSDRAPSDLKPSELKLSDAYSTAAGKKLRRLNVENETDALVAYHKGKLKYAYFRNGLASNAQFNSYSMAKSLIGYLVLKAIDEGEIDSVKTPIGTYLLDLKDEALRKQTIEQFLTMRSGLKIEKKGPPKPLAMDVKRKPDKNASNPFTLLAKMHIEGLPGIEDELNIQPNASTEFHYQNVNTALLGKMLSQIYKKPLNVILSEKIWKPAGASHAHWRTFTNEGSVTPYCCLFATVRDWAKVALYLSQNGSPSAPFLSVEHERLINAKRYDTNDLHHGVYGLHVRHDILDREGETIQGPFTYFVGHGGQLVYLFPDYDLVIVRFGRKHTLLHSTAYYLWRIIQNKVR